MKKIYATGSISLLIGFSLLCTSVYSAEDGAEKYPHDALTNTWLTVEWSLCNSTIQTMRCAMRAIIESGCADASLCTQLYNRFSKSLLPTKDRGSQFCTFPYTLFEADRLFEDIPVLSSHQDHRQLITKIKNGMAKEREAKTYDYVAACLYRSSENRLPSEINEQIIKYLYRIDNIPQRYSAEVSNHERLFCPQDSFDGLSAHLFSGTPTSLFPLPLHNAYIMSPTTQIWFHENSSKIRLSDDYNFVDIDCFMGLASRLLAAEFSKKYLVALYENGLGYKDIRVFSLPRAKRRYVKTVSCKNSGIETVTVESIMVHRHADQMAQIVLYESADYAEDLTFVGIDKHNERFVYQMNNCLYSSPLASNKPQTIALYTEP